ncbi:lymphatic vessel endothelial hyaluronic acid receptor 1-like [Megalops cyprinoides]|uniref:lymphatic vessel endothelial hyaluronic acid receptor 1-like n=1 Tax=Megalops cyprinoides TaxID=118141 RepID=UPI0018641DED|nr:lymphatic vessel endothelial hyaluronic acid receptor 1-like [Megalops cyprinoides]
MAGVWLISCHFLTLAIFVLTLDPTQIKVYPENGAISGVFEASFLNSQNKLIYSFNASQARAVCQLLNVVIASKAQVEEAHRNGLETCRFGWIDGQIAVIPRITPSQGCGQNKVGIVVWQAIPSKLFDVFCFKSPDETKQLHDKTTYVPTTSKSTTGVPTIPTTTPTVPILHQSTQSALSTSHPHCHSTSTPPSPSSSSSSSFSLSPSLSPSASPPPLISTQSFTPHPDEPEEPHLTNTTAIGAVPIALLVLAVILLVLAAVAALWYYKTNRTSFSFWRRGQQKEDIETEVWEHFCIKDLKEQQAGIEMNGSRKNSSDMSLDDDPETRTDSP